MWGNLFGGAQPAPPPPQSLPAPASSGNTFSLGEEPPENLKRANNFGSPAAAGGIQSDLPVGVKATQASEKVRAITGQKIEGAWTALQKEFDVQKLVWQSCQVTRKNKEKSSQTEQLTSLFEKAFSLKPTDANAALKVVQEAVHCGQKYDIMNKSMDQASSNVLKETGTSAIDSRRQLAQRLDMASNPASLPKTEAQKSQLRTLLAQCEIDDAKLVRTIKKVLDLALPEEMAPASGAKRSNGFGEPVSGSKISSAKHEKGTPASKKTSSRVRSLGAPAAGSKMSSLLRQLPPPATSMKQVNTYGPLSADMSPELKSGKAAEKMQQLASQKIEDSWLQFRNEFNTQKLIWESRTRLKQVNAGAVSSLSSSIDAVLNMRTADPTGALRSLQPILATSEKNDLISNTMAKSMGDVMKQANLITERSRLAERLSTASVPATLPRGDADKKDLEALVVACELDDAKFESLVRKILLLPAPASDGGAVSYGASKNSSGHGSAVTGAKKSSGFAGAAVSKKTSSRRSNSTGGIKSGNAAAKPIVERIREDHAMQFDPPGRGAGRIEL